MCDLLRPTGYSSATKRPASYPESLFARWPTREVEHQNVSTKSRVPLQSALVTRLVGRLRSDDLYTVLPHYPGALAEISLYLPVWLLALNTCPVSSRIPQMTFSQMTQILTNWNTVMWRDPINLLKFWIFFCQLSILSIVRAKRAKHRPLHPSCHARCPPLLPGNDHQWLLKKIIKEEDSFLFFVRFPENFCKWTNCPPAKDAKNREGTDARDRGQVFLW